MTLIAHPAVLRDLIDEYEALAAGPDKVNSAQARQCLDDVTYTLRVSTGPVTSTLPWPPPSTSRPAPAPWTTRC